MNYMPIFRSDYDRTFKCGKEKFSCYSEKKLRELYPDGKFSVLGFARTNNTSENDCLVLGTGRMNIHNALKESSGCKTVGYIPISNSDEFIVVKQDRPRFTALMSMMFTF